MTQEKFLEIKEGYVKNIKRFISETGDIFPHITVFALSKKNESENAIIHIPIDEHFLSSEEAKDKFIDDVIPEVAKELKKEFIPEGIAWTSEAWIRVFDKSEGIPDDWKSKTPKKEVVMINLQFPKWKEFIVYEIKRLGKQVNEDGDLVDYVELVEEDFSGGEESGGRLSNLLEKFID